MSGLRLPTFTVREIDFLFWKNCWLFRLRRPYGD